MATNIKDFRFSIYINNDAARKSLIEMEQLSDKYTVALDKLAKAGKSNTAEYAQTKTKLDQVKAAMTDMSRQAGITSLSITQLTALKKTLNYEFSRAIPGTAHWEKLKTDIQTVNARMSQLRIQNNQTGLSIGKIADGMNRYIGMITMAAASLTGLILGVRKTIDAYAEWDDKLADVMKTTGLTKDQVKELNNELAKISTRTPQIELLNLARDAGKLGITGTKNIRDFVEAGNQINVALGEDLGEDAIKNIGKMVGVFEKSTKQLQNADLKTQMLAVGSAVNELGASSTASEPYLVAFAGRLGGVAKQAGISMTSILGFASALDQDMQQVEMSATALQNFIMKLMGDPAKFAKLAGIEVTKFTQLLNTDANAAIKQMLTALNQKGGFQALIPIFQDMGLDGARATGVLSSMAGSIDKIEVAQTIANKAMNQGVSITNEYNTKNNTAQAELEKARKGFQAMAVELGERLAPAMTFSTNGMSYFLKALKITIEFVAEHKRAIGTLIITLITYQATVKALALIEAIRNKEGAIGLALIKARALAENAGIIITQAYAAATMLLSGNIKGATQAVRVLNTAIKGSPWGWLAAAIGAAVAYLIIFKEKSDEASKFTEYYNQALERNTELLVAEQAEFKGLIRQAMSANEGTELRKNLIDQLNQKYPGFLSHLDAERVSNGELSRMLDNVNAMYRQKFKLVKENARIDALTKQLSDKELEKMKIEDELAKLRGKAITDGTSEAKREKELQSKLSQINLEQNLIEGNIELVQNKANQTKQEIENILNPSIDELEKKIAQYDKAWKIYHDRASKAEKEGRPEDQKYYLEQSATVAIAKTDAENKLAVKKKEEEDKKKNRKITTDDNIDVINGKVNPADKKAMLEAKRAEQKAWDELEKILDKELETEGKNGKNNISKGLNTELSKATTDKKEKDALVKNQMDFANSIRDSAWALAQEEIAAEEEVNEFYKYATQATMAAKQRQFDAAFQSLDDIKAIFNEETAAFKAAAIGQAIINTYAGATAAFAPPPVGAGPILGPILAATTIAAGLANVAKIINPQYAEGRYPVIGASDGHTYNAAYQSTPRTGLYTKATLLGGLGLVGERGSEIVISNPHVRHLQMNYPEVINTIYRTATRVPQFAAGNYPAPGYGTNTQADQQKSNGKEDLMIELLTRIARSNEKPFRGFITYNDLNDIINEVAKIENGLK
ncbi:MAG TPA: phage tail tape measure protein [Bacteroidales bacterium]|nr:MAG: phage tail tape measure protein [Bacteroidetes bacterium GWE2_42_24]OFY25328.1 MAG: phage tail tape measure protein [Bacteroidetes bacterium GWF2_43_11]HBZ67608.1 phage tail tape measure protein [Bacteroidales bacterium]